jgi:hypothetical protein
VLPVRLFKFPAFQDDLRAQYLDCNLPECCTIDRFLNGRYAVDAAFDNRMARLSVITEAGQGQRQRVLVDTSSIADAVFQVC